MSPAKLPPPRERQRPSATYNSWILLVVTVSLVVFMGIVTWYGRFPTRLPLEEPSDHEAIYTLAEGWRARWPQVPGPPEQDTAQGRAHILADRPAEALDPLTRALALDPDAPEPLLLLVVASAQLPSAEGALTAEQAQAVLDVLAETDAGHPLLPSARAWQQLRLGQPAAALEVEPAPARAEGWLARSRALQALDQDPLPAAEGLLAEAPGAADACQVVVRARLAAGRAADALAVLERCAEAGAGGAVLERLRGAALDGVGQPLAAAEAYQRAGADIHAAAILIQEGQAGAAAEAMLAGAEAGVPEVALHRLWWGLLAGEPARIEAALQGLAQAGGAAMGPEFDVARAAGALAVGHPELALGFVEDLEIPEARALAARARLAMGEGHSAEAVADAQAAREALPWQPRLRLLLAMALQADGQAEAAAAEIRAVLERGLQERSMYAGYRQRDLPWEALIPDSALAGLGPEAVAATRDMDVRAAVAILESGEGAAAGADVAGVERVRAALQEGRREEAVAELEGLVGIGEGGRGAVGLQAWLVALRRGG